MRVLKRNKRQFWYCLYNSTEPIYDDDGNEAGEKVLYKTGVSMYANISPATGIANTEQFGNLEDYDKVIVTDDLSCPIDELTVLFIDKQPEYKDDGTADTDDDENEENTESVVEEEVTEQPETEEANDTPTTCEPVYDYVVKRVAKSINSISIAVSKVKVT